MRVTPTRALRWTVAIWAMTIVGLIGPPSAAPAAAGNSIWVQIDPSTVNAGSRVTITASCADNNRPQGVTSLAFDRTVTLLPKNGTMQGTGKVSRTTTAQGYTVTLHCSGGHTPTTTLWVVAMAHPTKGPATGGGGTAGHGISAILVGGLAALVAGSGIGIVGLRSARRPTRR